MRPTPPLLGIAAILTTLFAAAAPAQCTPEWSDGFGPPGTDGPVHAITTFDSGLGPEAILAGAFSHAGGMPATHIARWDGTKVQSLGKGLPDLVRAACPLDPDGEGPLPAVLYAGGDFIGAFGHIAAWDGSSWTALGQGTDSAVRALAVEDQTGDKTGHFHRGRDEFDPSPYLFDRVYFLDAGPSLSFIPGLRLASTWISLGAARARFTSHQAKEMITVRNLGLFAALFYPAPAGQQLRSVRAHPDKRRC